MIITNEFHIAFYAASMITCLTVVSYTMIQKRFERFQNQIFMIMVMIVFLNALSGTVSAICDGYAQVSDTAYIVLQCSQFLYFLLHTALCPMLYVYVLCVTGTLRKRKLSTRILFQIPFFITELFVIANPLMGWVYYYDSEMQFHRNWAESLIYAAAALYFLLAMINLFFSWNAITTRRKMALLYFFALTVVGVLIQLFNINIKSELFAEALAMMGLMLSVEGEDERIDYNAEVYNRHALQMDVQNYLSKKESVELLFLKIVNAGQIERAMGSSNNDLRSEAVATFLRTLIPGYRIYHANDDCFVLVLDKKDELSPEEIETAISERFSREWVLGSAQVGIEQACFRAMVPEELKDIEELFYAVDCIIPPNVSKNAAAVSYILRRAEIERLIKKNMTEGLFEVYYQPTYSLKDEKLHGAEALVRMKTDPSTGYISPEEFIPIAEQNGMVEEIDDFVLEEVCKLIESGVLEGSGIDCINVNLSVVQCIRPGFVEHLLEIVDRYSFEHRMLNFEITETVDAGDYHRLAKVTGELKKHGFLLSMDDYGTGYSNVGAIFSLDFDVVKIDKSILWNALRDKAGMTILSGSVRMIQDLGLKVLAEGVETEEHLNLIKKLNVDFLQGYHYSKPIPEDEFKKFIDTKRYA